MVTAATKNAASIEADIDWFMAVVDQRLQSYFSDSEEKLHFLFASLPPPELKVSESYYAKMVCELGLVAEERLMLILTIIPHVNPQCLDVFFSKNAKLERGFTEFGGLVGQAHSGFLPTIETALFLLAGDILELRFEAMRFLDSGATLFASKLLPRV